MVTGTWGWLPRMCRVDLQVLLLGWYSAGPLVRHTRRAWNRNGRGKTGRVPVSLQDSLWTRKVQSLGGALPPRQ